MSDVVIRAEGLGKRYLIGHRSTDRERYTALRDVVGQSLMALRSSAIDILRGRQIVAGDEVEEFWALEEVSFEIRRGDVVGIIGRNGAGKSTLLKILSRITEPSKGRVVIKGRVASLLEVGTGFHPELTGRENVYLNGAILGMTRAEIRRKFEEIVEFAGVEKFLDTPVKRYSSGMYVRLAFAVAAHLEPEILIIDEVLSVGDAEFQKKCLGKMGEVAEGGRTVLFVSHQVSLVGQLCSRAIVLEHGKVKHDCAARDGVESYIAALRSPDAVGFQRRKPLDGRPAIMRLSTVRADGSHCSDFSWSEGIQILAAIELSEPISGLCLGIAIRNSHSTTVATWLVRLDELAPRAVGTFTVKLEVAPRIIARGRYDFRAGLSMSRGTVLDHVEGVCGITIHDTGSPLAEFESFDYGCVIIPAEWRLAEGTAECR